MKAILSAALVIGLCGLAGAQGDKAGPVGTWKCEYEIGGMKRTSTLTIKKDGTLTFSAVRMFMDNKFPVEYKLTIDGDKLKGKGAADFMGMKQEFDIEGKREKKDK